MTITRIGLSLKSENGAPPDLHLDETGGLAVVTNSHAIGQHVAQRLKTFEGEWFLDKFAGVTWLTDVLGQQNNTVMAETLMKAEILETDGVTEIEAFSVRFDQTTRGLKSHDVLIKTEYDERVTV